jgi:hypothetical protein
MENVNVNLMIVFGGIILVGFIIACVLPIQWFYSKKTREGFQQTTDRKAYQIRYLKNDPWTSADMKEWNTLTREERRHLEEIQEDSQNLFKRYQTILESQIVGAKKQYESWKTMSPEVRILANQKENPVEKFYKALVNPATKTSRVLGSESMESYQGITFQKSLPRIIIPEPPVAPDADVSPENTGIDRDIAEIPFYEKIPNYLMSIPPLLPTIQDNLTKLSESIAGKPGKTDPEDTPEFSLYERVEVLRVNTEKAKRDAKKLNESSTEGFQQLESENKKTLDVLVPNVIETMSVIQKRIQEVYLPAKKVLEELEKKQTKTEQTLKELQEDAERVREKQSQT